MRHLKITIGILSVVLIICLIGSFYVYDMYKDAKAEAEAAKQPAVITTTDDTVKRVDIYIGGDPILGSLEAPVRIVEFGDFQSAENGQFYKKIFPLLKQAYIDTGKVKLVFKDFPMEEHGYAQYDAEAASCAQEQGRFWDYHNKLFENQAYLDTGSLRIYATDLMLDFELFKSCMDHRTMATEVYKDAEDGKKLGVSFAPAFFVNGILVNDPTSYASFSTLIDQELASQ
jgi:protein-disulfide isomerase